MKIAVEGCAHGELDKIYEAIAALEKDNGFKVDFLIICGDFQAVRNKSDLECMAVPPKYRKLNTFYKYYSGEKTAPILTIFIGGNHEASNYLTELSYGGWVCPNIYYMGYANVVNVSGVRIAGLSGIYKGRDYLRGHFERLPYDESSKKSVYHVRNLDVFRLKQITKPVDICFSHDWPRGVHKYGNVEALLERKPFFREDIEKNVLGSQPAEELLDVLKPEYWFAAHLHCKFAALIPHDDDTRPCTKFLSLDKCLPRRNFLQVFDVGGEVSTPQLSYDTEWLAILRSTNHLLNIKRAYSYMPGSGGHERYNFAPTSEEIQEINDIFKGDFKVPNNFEIVAPIHDVTNKSLGVKTYPNPQTEIFCKLLNIDDVLKCVEKSRESVSISDFTYSDASYSSLSSTNKDEISLSDDDDDTDQPEKLKDPDVSDSHEFFIDRLGSPNLSSNAKNFLSTQHSSTPIVEKKLLESFPELKETIVGDDADDKDAELSPFKKFKRRNYDLYKSDCEDPA